MIGGKLLRDGNTLFFGSATQAFITQSLVKQVKPTSIEVTPDGITAIQMGLLDQREGYRGAWLLDYVSGDDVSYIWYTDDVYNSAPDWTQGVGISGHYTVIRQTSGGISAYRPTATGTFSTTYDFTIDEQGFVPVTDPQLRAVYVAGVGWHKSPLRNDRVSIVLELPEVVNQTSLTVRVSSCTLVTSIGVFPTGYVACSGGEANWTGAATPAGFISTDVVMDASVDPYITSITIEGETTLNACTRFSTTNGATFGSEIAVGDSPGSTGGFDAARTGGVTLAAADAQAYKATSLGGAYATLGSGGATAGSDPVLLILPYYAWGSTSAKNYPDTTPDYLLGSAAEVGGEALWKVTGAGSSTAITDSTGGNKVLPVGPNAATTLYGTKIAYIGTAGGNRYLSISANAGSTWTRVQVGANAVFVRVRRGSTNGQIYVADGTAIKFSRNFTTTALVSKPTPAAGNLTWVDPLG